MTDHHLMTQAIQKLADKQHLSFEQARQQFESKLQDLLSQGRLDLSTVDIKERCRVHKFDHSQSDVPQLIETIEVDEHGQRKTYSKEQSCDS